MNVGHLLLLLQRNIALIWHHTMPGEGGIHLISSFHYESHDQLRTHLDDFIAAYNFARRLKTLSGLTPYEYIAKIWTSKPDRFIADPINQMPGLKT